MDSSAARPTEFEFCSLHASTAVLCCGSCFDSQLVADDGNIYRWLALLFNSNNEKVSNRILFSTDNKMFFLFV